MLILRHRTSIVNTSLKAEIDTESIKRRCNNKKSTDIPEDLYKHSWLGKRGVIQTILEDYRGQDIEAEIQEIQQLVNGDEKEAQSC